MTQVSGTISGAFASLMPTVQPAASPAVAAAGAGEGSDTAERAQLKKTAKAFEAIFVRQMLGTMRKASLGEDIAGGSGVDQFREMSDAKLADNLSDKGTLGIANLLLGQLDKKKTS